MLIPRLAYGARVYRPNPQNLAKIRKILNEAVTLATGKGNASIRRRYEELEVHPIEELAVWQRVKSLKKWKHENRITGDLARSTKYKKTLGKKFTEAD